MTAGPGCTRWPAGRVCASWPRPSRNVRAPTRWAGSRPRNLSCPRSCASSGGVNSPCWPGRRPPGPPRSSARRSNSPCATGSPSTRSPPSSGWISPPPGSCWPPPPARWNARVPPSPSWRPGPARASPGSPATISWCSAARCAVNWSGTSTTARAAAVPPSARCPAPGPVPVSRPPNCPSWRRPARPCMSPWGAARARVEPRHRASTGAVSHWTPRTTRPGGTGYARVPSRRPSSPPSSRPPSSPCGPPTGPHRPARAPTAGPPPRASNATVPAAWRARSRAAVTRTPVTQVPGPARGSARAARTTSPWRSSASPAPAGRGPGGSPSRPPTAPTPHSSPSPRPARPRSAGPRPPRHPGSTSASPREPSPRANR